jgi:hypothetical protein
MGVEENLDGLGVVECGHASPLRAPVFSEKNQEKRQTRILAMILLCVFALVIACVANRIWHIRLHFTPEEFEAGISARLSTLEEWTDHIVAQSAESRERVAQMEGGPRPFTSDAPVHLYDGYSRADIAWEVSKTCTSAGEGIPFIATRTHHHYYYLLLSKEKKVIGYWKR